MNREETQALFPAGVRVRLSKAGVDAGFKGAGNVDGHSHKYPGCIWVKLDGNKTRSLFSAAFWELQPDPDSQLLVANS